MSGVVTLGESMVVLTPTEVGPLRHARTLEMGVAGAESNVAIGVARLGVAATWIGRVGDDEPGRLITATLRGEGVRSVAIVDESAPTGLMMKERRTSAATNVSYYRAGSAGSRLSRADLDEALIADADVVHITGITPALSSSAADAVRGAIAIARAHGVAVSLDVNFRSRLWTSAQASTFLASVIDDVDVLFAGDDELGLVGERRDASAGPREVIVKRGARGASAVIDGAAFEAPLFAVQSLDPVGAGDAFAAGYLAARCRGLAPADRLEVAAATGAFAVTVRGDWEGAPTWGELDLVRDGSDEVRR